MAAVGIHASGGGAVAGPQRFRRRAAPSLKAGGASAVSDGAHLVCGRQLRPTLLLASSFGILSSQASRQLLRRPAATASSDPAGLVSLSFLPAVSALRTADS